MLGSAGRPSSDKQRDAPSIGTEASAAAALIEWARQRSSTPRGRRQRRQATILARDVLTLVSGVRTCCLLDAEHGAFASDADALCEFLRGSRPSSTSSADIDSTVVVEELTALQVLGVTFNASASEADTEGEAVDALFVVHRSRLAARCAAANSAHASGPAAMSACMWGGTAIVDATPCPGVGSQTVPRLCRDVSVVTGLQCGVQAIAAAVGGHASPDALGYSFIRIDPSISSPTLLTAWLLEYPVGYYVAQPATSNILGGEELVLFSVRAELAVEESKPPWLQLEASSNGLAQPSTLCSFSVPHGLLVKEQIINDMIQAWCTRLTAVLAPSSTDAAAVAQGSTCRIWRSPCAAKAQAFSASFSDQGGEPMHEADEQTLVWQLELLPWLTKQRGVVLEQVAL